MNDLDRLACEAFPGLVVRKDLVRKVKGGAVVPSYVLEYLLGQYCATSDDAAVESGIESVKSILAQHYVHRSEAELIRSVIREQGRHRVIDKVSVALNDRDDFYEASFSNLGLTKVPLNPDTVKANLKLLVGGVWSIVDLEYHPCEDKRLSPWTITKLKPIQMASFDMDSFKAGRGRFSLDQWTDLLIQSLGFNPALFDQRGKLIQLARLIPFCERNYNLIELGPKGTGKSHVYSEFSPHGILISGGEVTAAKLFVNNASGRIGLVGYWDAVAFDEFAGRSKRTDKALVDIMKNYMANKSFSRGIETLGAEASMVFVGNTGTTVEQMLRQSNLFADLPGAFCDSAFLDRLHCYLPGWEVENIRSEMFSDGYGFVVDYLAEVLRALRNLDESDRCRRWFSLSPDLSTRDRYGILKTLSGLMKILFPAGGESRSEAELLLRFAMEGRKRVKDQVMRIDPTYSAVSFGYYDEENCLIPVKTFEEERFPEFYSCGAAAPSDESAEETEQPEGPTEAASFPAVQAELKPVQGAAEAQATRIDVAEGQGGVCFDDLFGPWLTGASSLLLIDPYVRNFFQIRNLMEFLETVIRFKGPEVLDVHLITGADQFNARGQMDLLKKVQDGCVPAQVEFTWEFSDLVHDRFLYVDKGWRIALGRGLDIFQRFEANDAFSLENRLQCFRRCKVFSVSYERMTEEEILKVFQLYGLK